jgi:hypothetical protein
MEAMRFGMGTRHEGDISVSRILIRRESVDIGSVSRSVPQGLKPSHLVRGYGTAKAAPLQIAGQHWDG